MRFRVIVLLATLAPAVLVAQGGMGGMGGMGGGRRGGGMGQMGPRGSGGLPKFATAKELERFNAADALLTDQKKLKLTETQVTALTSLRATLYEKNADLLVRYDSVRRNYKPPAALTDTRGPVDEASMPSQTEMVALRDQMLLMMSLGEQLMERRTEQVASCIALVDDTQKDRATKMLEDQTDELRKQVPERPSPNGRSPRR